MPAADSFEYSFEHISLVMEKFIDLLGIKKFSMYIQDYGSPVGLRLVTRRPQLLECLLVQNGNAYAEGLGESWAPLKAIWTDPHDPAKRKKVFDFMQLEGTMFQYLEGTTDPSAVAPDSYSFDQALLDRPGIKEIQYKLLYDYQNNVKAYTSWQKMLREKQPPTLIVWGENDVFFLKRGALAYGNDIKNIEFNFYKTGHFALEEFGDDIAEKIDCFLEKNLSLKK
ncbi:MAG: alpha/beta hydrolase [Ferruginibacter sp.]